jgi:hypothetical protein
MGLRYKAYIAAKIENIFHDTSKIAAGKVTLQHQRHPGPHKMKIGTYEKGDSGHAFEEMGLRKC